MTQEKAVFDFYYKLGDSNSLTGQSFQETVQRVAEFDEELGGGVVVVGPVGAEHRYKDHSDFVIKVTCSNEEELQKVLSRALSKFSSELPKTLSQVNVAFPHGMPINDFSNFFGLIEEAGVPKVISVESEVPWRTADGKINPEVLKFMAEVKTALETPCGWEAARGTPPPAPPAP